MAIECKHCRACPNSRSGCDPNLRPEILVTRGLGGVSIRDLGSGHTFTDCRHHTCDSDGQKAMRGAMDQYRKGNFTGAYPVVEIDGSFDQKNGVVFGSRTKPTKRRPAQRIVALNKRGGLTVYSSQDGVFYQTRD